MSHRLRRRTFLKGMAACAGAIAAGGVHGRRSQVLAQLPLSGAVGSRPSVDVLINEPIRDAHGNPALIDPMVHGHFVEHLGGVVYDGIWVGPDSKVPNEGGIRRSLVESLRKIGPAVIRWPGGCFADRYHWRDGIGPREQRPRRYGRWADATESNHFGTQEFMRFCRQVGAQPYFAANVGSGTTEEFQQWVEYCNAPAGRTTLADERAANGDAEPFGVRFWGVGNENWACGGTFTPEDYCSEYRRFTTWVPGYGVPLFLIGCGPNGNDVEWTRRLLKKWVDSARAPLHGVAAHYYCGTSGTSTQFTTEQWYDLLLKASRMEKLVTDQWGVMGEFDRERNVRLLIDEWGCWHPANPSLNPAHQFAQVSTLRDALVAAMTLDIFHRNAEKVLMSNVAQLVNCLHSLYMADGDQFVETVNYHVYAMYSPHLGATALPIRIAAPTVRWSMNGKEHELFRLAGSASVRDKIVTVTLVHTHASEPVEIALRLAGAKATQVSGIVLNHERLSAANTFGHPQQVLPRELKIPAPGPDGQIVASLPPASVTRLQLALA